MRQLELPEKDTTAQKLMKAMAEIAKFRIVLVDVMNSRKFGCWREPAPKALISELITEF